MIIRDLDFFSFSLFLIPTLSLWKTISFSRDSFSSPKSTNCSLHRILLEINGVEPYLSGAESSNLSLWSFFRIKY